MAVYFILIRSNPLFHQEMEPTVGSPNIGCVKSLSLYLALLRECYMYVYQGITALENINEYFRFPSTMR